MRIVFIGAEQAGYDVLESLLDIGENIVGIITKAESEDIADYISFDHFRTSHHEIPFISLTANGGAARTYCIQKVRVWDPDLIIVVSWSQIIPKEILEIPKLGTIGIHYSLLPERRGGAPIAWALIDGLEKSGITLFYYTDKIDEGDMIAQKEFDIRDGDRPDDLLKIINRLCVEIVKENLPRIKDGTAPRIKQDESKATWTPRREPDDSEIVDRDCLDRGFMTTYKPIQELYNFLRALDDPYPHAFIKMGNKRFEFERAHLTSDKKEIYCHCTITEVEDDAE